MPALERALTTAATALVLVPVGLTSQSLTATVRLPITQPNSGHIRLFDPEAAAGSSLPKLLPGRPSASGARGDVFTAADMAVLDAVERAVVTDTLNYIGLFDYDDD